MKIDPVKWIRTTIEYIGLFFELPIKFFHKLNIFLIILNELSRLPADEIV